MSGVNYLFNFIQKTNSYILWRSDLLCPINASLLLPRASRSCIARPLIEAGRCYWFKMLSDCIISQSDFDVLLTERPRHSRISSAGLGVVIQMSLSDWPMDRCVMT